MTEGRERDVVRLVAIEQTPLDVTAVLEALGDDAAGGLNLFVGRVRDHDRRGGCGQHGPDDTGASHGDAQAVTGLDYSAHPTALDRLREVCERVAARHDVRAVAAVHRVGELAIGDLAVVVATAAAHRGESFAATRDLIDTLKAEVPIWKHQRFADGSDEWVGTP
ncbi:molybdenum cofactor biosynthesis protein MoaE [Nocardioides jiangxiensis]|uniref:Molybdenum cofactor biosynthesis protein MoaE n=1 Tax=Nocardioides jiangxiensis TaxID=3064524 RepID=A0ABT9AZM2_9ACTN|nr:molybdenum cofactor biosynthesis protein MoaE [Nocardioides sp. WY-20]MDO7867418.1 molybdenum cofactor biosynthesis protein MoaE [Nocardioides sp. WY-20]